MTRECSRVGNSIDAGQRYDGRARNWVVSDLFGVDTGVTMSLDS